MPATSGITVRLRGGLDWFVRGRPAVVRLPTSGRRSAKDAVEAAGVPHVEVGELTLDGRGVGFAHVVGPGSVLTATGVVDHEPEVPLRDAPPAPPRFVADVHLGTLARRLRLAGFSTWYRTDADDPQLADVAVAGRRILLSRDRGLLKRRAVVHGQCPRSADPDEQLTEVAERWDLRSHSQPLSRCAACDALLAPVARHEVLDRLPPRTRVEHDVFARCSGCGRVYWPGSHVAELRARHPSLYSGLGAGSADRELDEGS